MAAERYARVTRRIWTDERFRALSRSKPSARELWLFLLTCPTRGGVPGLLPMGELSLSEAIEWPLVATRAYLAEIELAGLIKVDRMTRLIWLPKALHHNAPESPNVVLSWSAAWRELPECSLKDEAADAALAFLATYGEAYAEAFRQVLNGWTPKPRSKPYGKPSSKTTGNQSQSQIDPLTPRSGESPSVGSRSRSAGTNPRAVGTNPRAAGTNPRFVSERDADAAIAADAASRLVPDAAPPPARSK